MEATIEERARTSQRHEAREQNAPAEHSPSPRRYVDQSVYPLSFYLLLSNIGLCPTIAAEVYLSSRRDAGKLYSESYAHVSVMFASIPNYLDFFTEEEIHQGGVNCLKILNEIISSYDKVRMNVYEYEVLYAL